MQHIYPFYTLKLRQSSWASRYLLVPLNRFRGIMLISGGMSSSGRSIRSAESLRLEGSVTDQLRSAWSTCSEYLRQMRCHCQCGAADSERMGLRQHDATVACLLASRVWCVAVYQMLKA